MVNITASIIDKPVGELARALLSFKRPTHAAEQCNSTHFSLGSRPWLHRTLLLPPNC